MQQVVRARLCYAHSYVIPRLPTAPPVFWKSRGCSSAWSFLFLNITCDLGVWLGLCWLHPRLSVPRSGSQMSRRNTKRVSHHGWQPAVPHKVTYRMAIGSGTSKTSGYIPKNGKQRSNGCSCPHVRSGVVHKKSQEVETTQTSIDGQPGKQNVVQPYNGTLLSLKREGNSDSCYSLGEPRGRYAKWDKPVTEGQMLYDCT